MPTQTPYEMLEDVFGRVMDIRRAIETLDWDRSAIMAPGSVETRARQMGTLEGVALTMQADSGVGQLIGLARQAGGLDDWPQANLTEMERLHRHAAAVPLPLMVEFATATARSEWAWRQARAANDWSVFAPALKDTVAVMRRIGAAKAAATGGATPYDGLVDHFNPGMPPARLYAIFDDLEQSLPGLIARAEQAQAQAQRPAALPIQGGFPVGTQQALDRRFMQILGFDFARGALGTSLHPLTSGGRDDARITNRYREDNFLVGWSNLIHETGHALYRQNLPAKWKNQPVGQIRGSGADEMQALVIEMMLGRDKDFLAFAAPVLAQAFKGQGPEWQADNIHRHLTGVKRSLIRADADEVTYNAHVLLRYQLEKALINGALEVDDLPQAWNGGMQRLLGVTPADANSGVLQDMHWGQGGFGYFPTYSMGLLGAAQLYEAARKALPNLGADLAKGDVKPLTDWLAANVQGEGCRHDLDALMVKATGAPLSTDAWKRHVAARYLPPAPPAAPKRGP